MSKSYPTEKTTPIVYGALDKSAIDLSGVRFAMLVVISYVGFCGGGKRRKGLWLCRCDCGEEKIIKSDLLRHGSHGITRQLRA